jgi:hypothetical protein
MVFGTRSNIRQVAWTLLLGFLWVFPTPAPAQTLPTLPQATVDTTMPPITGNTFTVNAGGNLQAAINSAASADPNQNHQIVIQAGATFQGSFTLPARAAGTGWIILRSSALGSLPAEGRRVFPSDASNMPLIQAQFQDQPAFVAASGSRNYRLVGLRISHAGPHTQLVQLGFTETQASQLPTGFIVDRCYIHATGNQATRGIALHGRSMAVIDSYLDDFARAGVETQAIHGGRGDGPFLIQNNYLGAAGENIMIGGIDASITNLTPSDITVRRNHIKKNLAWRGVYPVKNLLELKHAQRVLIEGNILEYCWLSAQNGHAMQFTVRNENGGNPWAKVQDVTFRYNILRHASGSTSIHAEDNNQPSQQTQRIRHHDNVIDDISNANWGGYGWAFMLTTYRISVGHADLIFDHNTVFATRGNGEHEAPSVPFQNNTRATWQNNIMAKGQSGFFGSGSSDGDTTISAHYVPPVEFRKNVLIGSAPSAYTSKPDNYFPANTGAVGFVDYAGGNYRLAAGSPYKGLGVDFNGNPDGTDPGANIDAVEAATAGVITGSWTSDSKPPTAPSGLTVK